MNGELIFIIILIVVLLVWATLFGGRLPKPYAQRSCEGKGWRTTFPNASKSEIREYLQTFVDAFAFDESEKLKLSPNDRILDIYKSLYPKEWMADSLEVETFADDLESRYGYDLVASWNNELTLGNVFAKIVQESKPVSNDK